MRRTSVKKSSMFKVQADKTIYKKCLDNIQNCLTVKYYPHLLQSIQKTSQIVYNYCYNFSQDTPLSKGINYDCKTYGLSYPSSITLIIRQWIPNAKQVYLLGNFNNFNQHTHPLHPVQTQKDIYTLQLDIQKQHINNQDQIILKIIDTQNNIHLMPPPSCKIRSDNYAYICNDIGITVMKHQKKQDIIIAYTIDLKIIQLSNVLTFLDHSQHHLSNFNTIILKNLFINDYLIDRGTLTLQQKKYLRDIINKVKNQMSLKIIIQWNFQPGKLKYGITNPIEKQLFKPQQNDLWSYDIKKPQVTSLYLANLSYYLSSFHIDGYHFKNIDKFCKDEYGLVVIKCINIMNQRLHQNGLTLASCKKQVPGLNLSIFQGGLGFSFSYNYSNNYLRFNSINQLVHQFNQILSFSNCIPINFDQFQQDNQINFLFTMLISNKGLFCKGNLSTKQKLLLKLSIFYKQPQLFTQQSIIKQLQNDIILVQRGKIKIFFYFYQHIISCQYHHIQLLQLIHFFGNKQPEINQSNLRFFGKSCAIFQDNCL